MTTRASKLKIPSRVRLLRRPLRSERLELSPIDIHDADSFYYAVEESRSALEPWLPWVPHNHSIEDSQRYAAACERDWISGTAARFFVRLIDTDRVIGVVSLENCSPTHRGCYLGYWLHVSFWGRGLMTEAAERALSFAFEEMNAHRVVCAAGTQNLRSLKVIERLGLHFEGVAREAEWIEQRWISHAVHSVLASEWQERPVKTRSV